MHARMSRFNEYFTGGHVCIKTRRVRTLKDGCMSLRDRLSILCCERFHEADSGMFNARLKTLQTCNLMGADDSNLSTNCHR
jgi:hypothetical protein